MTRQERSKKVWAKWRKLVSEQVRSGRSVAAFCHERGLCAPHFFAWKKRLREVATPRQPQGNEAAQFVEVKLVAAASTAGESRVEVRLTYRSLEFYARTTEENQTLTEPGDLKQGSSSRNSEKIATPEAHYTYTALGIFA